MWSAAMAQKHPELIDMLYEVALRFVELKEKAASASSPSDSNDARKGQSG